MTEGKTQILNRIGTENTEESETDQTERQSEEKSPTSETRTGLNPLLHMTVAEAHMSGELPAS